MLESFHRPAQVHVLALGRENVPRWLGALRKARLVGDPTAATAGVEKEEGDPVRTVSYATKGTTTVSAVGSIPLSRYL